MKISFLKEESNARDFETTLRQSAYEIP